MARRKNPPSDTTLYIALAAAGAALYYLMSPKAAAQPGIGGDVFNPPGGGPPDGSLPDGFMPTDKAKTLQQRLNAFYLDDGRHPSGKPKLVTDGKFGPLSFAYLQASLPYFVKAAQWAAEKGMTDLSFFSSADNFSAPTDTDKITFRLVGSSDSVVLRKSLYDRLSSPQTDSSYTANDQIAWKESPVP